MRPTVRTCGWILFAAALGSFTPRFAAAEGVQLRNGMQHNGAVAKVASVSAAGAAAQVPGGVQTKTTIVIDDGLRRVFVPMYQLKNLVDSGTNTGEERFQITQRVFNVGKTVVAVGPIMKVEPFDAWGRRRLTMGSGNGPVDVIQGITDITPRMLRVQGLASRNALVWDMRVATSTLPREQLSRILLNHLNPKSIDDRKRIVQLYLQAERVPDARAELQTIFRDFPEIKELEEVAKSLNQVAANLMLKEIDRRSDAGQYLLSVNLLQNFPSEGVAGEVLLKARERLQKLEDRQAEGAATLKKLREFETGIEDEKLKVAVAPFVDEIAAELNLHNLDRLADFKNLIEDTTMTPDQKVALAVSGWMLDTGNAVVNLGVAVSTGRVRNLAREYLRTKPKAARDALLREIRSEEAGTPSIVAKILAAMCPPFAETETDEVKPVNIADERAILGPRKGEAASVDAEAGANNATADARPAGLITRTVPGLPEDPQITYHIQLPPEYSPYRRYPVIVTLNGAGTTPQQQIDWWAGQYNPEQKMRYGQAGRHGYIVVAPEWIRDHQRKYEYSAREHAAVLYTLRDVCRRYSVDTDKVFLSGHSMGGDAVWDIGLAHPDLWAGLIPIVASADKYVLRYPKNAEFVPFYFVGGERDGNKRELNSSEWDRYLSKGGCDVTIVEYLGRGHEHFYEEVNNIFDWMRLHTRKIVPERGITRDGQPPDRGFVCTSMRPWDSFFWFVEIDKLPASATLVPVDWTKAGEVRPIETEGRILANNGISVKSGAGKITVWLSPEWIDFNNSENRPIVTIRGKRYHNLEPSVDVLLEDCRTRGDRLHPFWGRVDD